MTYSLSHVKLYELTKSLSFIHINLQNFERKSPGVTLYFEVVPPSYMVN